MRPAAIFKASHSTFGDDVLVIPLLSAGKDRKGDAFDIFVPKDASNKLFQNSHARLRQTRAVSVKRIGRKIGEITDETIRRAINEQMIKMLGIEQ